MSVASPPFLPLVCRNLVTLAFPSAGHRIYLLEVRLIRNRAMPRSGCRLGAVFNNGSKFARRFERRDRALRDFNNLACFRIPSRSRGPGYDLKGAETPDFDMLAALESI